jgi:P27 family predicted phage terminase small subunit
MKIPDHLGPAGREFFATVAAEYQIVDPAGLTLLAVAGAALDRMQQAQDSIAQHGALVAGASGQLRANPACALERDARTGFLSAMRALNLDVEPLRDRPGRPAGTYNHGD